MAYFRNFQKTNIGDPKPEKSEKKKKKPIKKFSEKRAKENKIYLEIRKDFLSEKPYCEFRFDGCTNLSTDVHHTLGRTGNLLCDIRYFMSVCRNCHRKHHDS